MPKNEHFEHLPVVCRNDEQIERVAGLAVDVEALHHGDPGDAYPDASEVSIEFALSPVAHIRRDERQRLP